MFYVFNSSLHCFSDNFFLIRISNLIRFNDPSMRVSIQIYQSYEKLAWQRLNYVVKSAFDLYIAISISLNSLIVLFRALLVFNMKRIINASFLIDLNVINLSSLQMISIAHALFLPACPTMGLVR